MQLASCDNTLILHTNASRIPAAQTEGSVFAVSVCVVCVGARQLGEEDEEEEGQRMANAWPMRGKRVANPLLYRTRLKQGSCDNNLLLHINASRIPVAQPEGSLFAVFVFFACVFVSLRKRKKKKKAI